MGDAEERWRRSGGAANARRPSADASVKTSSDVVADVVAASAHDERLTASKDFGYIGSAVGGVGAVQSCDDDDVDLIRV